jgi:hypothetical protein
MHLRWYQKTWLWLCVISVLVFVTVVLFAIYLISQEYITIIDIRFLFANDDGSYDWGIFWTFVGAVGSIFVAVLAYILSRRLAKIQVQQYDMEATPFIMLRNVALKSTHVLTENRIFVGFEGINFPYFKDNITPDAASSGSPKYFEIELMNTSKTFTRVIFRDCEFENKGEILLGFNGSTNSIRCNDLFLEQNSVGSIGLVFSDNGCSLKGSEVKLNLLLRNNYGDVFEQKIEFFCIGIDNGNVLYGLKGFMKPTKMEK